MVIYIVEEVLDEKMNLLGHTYTLVKWKNFSDGYNSWILKEELGEVDNEACEEPQLEDGEELSNFISDSDVLAQVLSRRQMVAYNYQDIIIENYFYQSLEISSKNYLLV